MSTLTCFTIGHSNHSIEYFIDLLSKHNVNCVVDVRSSPYSKHNPQFNKENLKQNLEKMSFTYLYMGDLLGGRYTTPELLYPDGKVDFSKVIKTKQFCDGIQRIITGMEKGYTIAIMCSEKNPLNCHRFGLISYELTKRGISVKHILENTEIVLHDELEKQILNEYKKDSQQEDLFNTSAEDNVPLLEKAYELRNKKITYNYEEKESI